MITEEIITKIEEFNSLVENSKHNNIMFNILYKMELENMLNQKGIDLFNNISTYNFYKSNGELD